MASSLVLLFFFGRHTLSNPLWSRRAISVSSEYEGEDPRNPFTMDWNLLLNTTLGDNTA